MITDIKNVKDKKVYIINIIKEELENLNYNFEYIGTQYLIDAIYLLYSLKMYYKFSLESEVYPAIANMYGDNANAVKAATIYATDKMFYDCDSQILQKYLDDKYKSKRIIDFKPGPKIIIRAVLRRIKDL